MLHLFASPLIWHIEQMEADDDPEKRIRQLERELADLQQTPREAPPLTGDPPPYPGPPPQYTAGTAPYTGNVTRWGDARYQPTITPRRSEGIWPSLRILMLIVMVLSTGAGFVSIAIVLIRSNAPTGSSGSSGPMAGDPGGSLQLNGTAENHTIACNGGNLALDGMHSTSAVTGHCSSIRVGGYSNNVTVENVDTLISNGYGNTVTDHACNSCDLTIASYNNTFTVTGHSTSLRISSYSNKVTVDSVDAITVAGYQNTVTYHSGTPKTTDSGYSNIIRQG